MARLTIYHRSPIIYRYVIRGVPGDESTNVGQYLVVRFVRATDKDTGKDCMILRSGVDDDGLGEGRNNRPVRIRIDDALTERRGAALGDSLRLPIAASSSHRHLRRRLHGRANLVQT